MKVPRVSTETGQSVTLQFGANQVQVHPLSPARQRAAKTAVGGLLLCTGLATVAVNATDRGIAGLDVALWSGVWLTLAAALVGAIWWLVLTQRDGRRGAEVIAASAVLDAQSKADNATVTVSLRLDDGGERSFAAVGHSGALLSAGFSRLLTVTDEPAEQPGH